LPVPGFGDHKYTRGHALVYAGAQMTGAARLAAENAARAGAGLVSLVCSPGAAQIFRSVMPAHIIVRDDTSFSDRRVTARVIGPGGMPDSLPRLLAARPAAHCVDVLDGEALQADTKLDDNCIITPHEGEFSRVFGDIDGGHKCKKTKNAAARFGGVVVYKGADTVIADDKRTVVNANAPPWLATAGAGDSLAGIVAGLAGQGMPAFEAACCAVWLHGTAARAFGPGLVAADIADQLPGLLWELY
jgi:NAD(P)H-hydrate epimerase